MAVLLIIWAVAGLGCGVLFADVLNRFHLGGFPLGFWFAQQGSIIIFVLLILAYSILLNRLDARYRAEVAASGSEAPSTSSPSKPSLSKPSLSKSSSSSSITAGSSHLDPPGPRDGETSRADADADDR